VVEKMTSMTRRELFMQIMLHNNDFVCGTRSKGRTLYRPVHRIVRLGYCVGTFSKSFTHHNRSEPFIDHQVEVLKKCILIVICILFSERSLSWTTN